MDLIALDIVMTGKLIIVFGPETGNQLIGN
jgi:hypothetical protein